MNEIMVYLYRSLPLIVALVVWAIRLEVKIATMSNDIAWIKGNLKQCQPSSENHTP